MALPNNTFSSTTVSAGLLAPDNQITGPLEDLERGGNAIGDGSSGLNVKNWRCYVDASNGADVYLEPAGGSATLIFSLPGITEVTFAFDQLMRPAVAYRIGNATFLRWFDSLVNAFVTTAFGDLLDPSLSFDDKRITQSGGRGDILFSYLRDAGGVRGLYYRQQRDRFTIEYPLRTGLPTNTRLQLSGMNSGLRMQWNLV